MKKAFTHSEDTFTNTDFSCYRAQLYATASAAFTMEPTSTQLEALVETACASDGSDCLRDCERQLFEHLRTYHNANFEELRTKVATEYAELFVGPRPPLAPLYESVYIGPVKRLNTDVTMQVRKFYERNGFAAVKRNSIPNDHIGLELEFMAHLCEREAAAWKSGDKAKASVIRHLQLQFLSMHLSSWIDLFAARLSQAWCAEYYEAWCRFAQSFVKEDDAYLSAELGIAV